MNLSNIATKCFILALVIRDDGERLLLGDGAYDFKDSQQHFQPNTYQNDVVELQGTDGQLLAGQVRRTASQKFDGYIGDATTSQAQVEEYRRNFIMFFRKKHFYKVVYIFPDGTAIQRKRGYITDAPSAPEILQRFPEWHIALNFEDPNYYEYAEDELGDEIYANIQELALAVALSGGLVWDAIGAVSDDATWSGIQTAQGEYIQITNELSLKAPLASVEMLGKAEQDGTPTPDSPQPISVVTGEQTVKIEGKNLFNTKNFDRKSDGVDLTVVDDNNIILHNSGTASWLQAVFSIGGLAQNRQYTLKFNQTNTNTPTQNWINIRGKIGSTTDTLVNRSYVSGTDVVFNTGEHTTFLFAFYVQTGAGTVANNTATITNIQLELGSTATAYEPYQGQTLPVNLGKNMFKFAQDTGSVTRNGCTIEVVENGAIKINGTVSGDFWCELMMSDNFLQGIQNTTTQLFALDSTKDYTLSVRLRSGTYTESTSSTNKTNVYVQTTSTNTQKNSNLGGTATTFTGADGIYRGWMRFIGGYTFNNAVLEIQLEEGNQQTSYAPYFTPIELAKIGNYQDRIYKEDSKWYIEKQVGKVVLDGTETWNTSENQYYTSILQSVVAPTPNTSTLLGYSQYFLVQGYNYQTDTNLVFYPNKNLQIRNTNYPTKTDWTTWLASHPTTVYYALATPTTTEITNEALIAQLDALGASSLYLGVNNIGTETQNAVPTLKIEYYTEVELDGAGYEWEGGGGNGNIITVNGVDSASPIWTIMGPANDPTLTNMTTGQTIKWLGFVPAGQTLTINMAEQTASLEGANVFEFIEGDWLELEPGNNRLVYSAGGGATDPSTLSWNGVVA